MNINSISSISFKGYVPVRYMAKNPKNDKYVPVIKNDNIRKCQSFVVRNLNGTAKNMRNDDFVNFYRAHDKDYRENPVVHSIYDENLPIVYMVTGNDTEVIKEYAKPVGIAKAESIDKIGHSKSFESQVASKNFFRNVKLFLLKRCRRLKSPQSGKDLSLIVYFNPQYTKSGNLTGFESADAEFIESESTKRYLI